MGLHIGFDDGFQDLAGATRQAAPVRLAMSAAIFALLGLNLGWATGGAWFAAILASEIFVFATSKPPADPGDRRAALLSLAATVAMSAAWVSSAVLYWNAGRSGFQVIAAIQLASILTVAQNLSFRSLLASVAFGAPAALALVILPLISGHFSGLELTAIGLSVAVALAYIANDVKDNAVHAQTLRETQARLEEQTQKALAASEAKSAFLAMMSHELRTPMNGVLGMARALSHTPLDPRQAEHVEMLLRSGESLMTILNDILDISKIEAGKLELEVISFDLHEVGQRVTELWCEPASAKGVRLIYALDPATPQWVLGDPTRLRQVMNNLVSNALKFTANGEVRLSIRSQAAQERAPETAARLEITVSDTGIGMTAEQQSRLFQSFSQADVSTTRRYGGTGLGLSICKELAERMGGTIGVDSGEGRGSVFSLSLALLPGEPVAESVQDDSGLDAGDLRVLVADDNPINLAVARAILEAAGAVVLCAVDGAQALVMLAGGDFDVVLMDVHMPRMDGIEALRRIRSGEAGPAGVPVIALTADAMAGADEALLARGFDAVEPKPIEPANLIRAIFAVCARQTPGPERVQAA